MTNKNLGLWVIWTLIGYIGSYCLDFSSEVVGLIALANWVFVIIAGLRLMKIK